MGFTVLLWRETGIAFWKTTTHWKWLKKAAHKWKAGRGTEDASKQTEKCVSDSDSSRREPCDKKTSARPVTHSKSSEMIFMMDLRHCKSISWAAMSESLQLMDNRPPGSSVHGISQARILEWVPISFSKGSSQSRDQTNVSCTGRQILYHWATREASKPCPNHELYVHSDQWV